MASKLLALHISLLTLFCAVYGKVVLVTGAAGFIGMHVSLKLHERGDVVVGIDNFNSYYQVSLKIDRYVELETKGIRVVRGDITDEALLRRLFEEHHFTDVIHLAAQAGVSYSLQNPLSYVTANVQGFTVLLEVVKDYPGTQVTYASSSSVYGLNEKVPFSETDRIDRTASMYAATKKADEFIARSYHHIYGIPMTGLRFFTVYGPWGRPDMAPYGFTDAIANGRPIKFYDNGVLERDFTYIDDIVDGTIGAMDRRSLFEIYNLGNSKPETVATLVRCIEDALGKKAILNNIPAPKTELPRTFANVTHAERDFGFRPTTPLCEGIRK
eukprot:CAMPEP_0177629616 /NCGR_PEP_ID=MMETSP0447-20121125/764_1 /TAXON_ID=0 /ORGANISM="Stygamoeba regulata, Strain BSH-02190019" /LENGTH=326 /DNA_ID=CAMNT_0019130951 /DNA_START=52 /DNA_END=1029 /DNA_ORIENTATION=+